MDYIKDNNKFWLYVITNNYLNEFINGDKKYLSSNFDHEIKKDDIIFLYKKGRKSGFIYVFIALNNQELNNETKIFTNNAANKYFFEVNELIHFKKEVKIRDIFSKIKSDEHIFSSEYKFRSKFIRGDMNFINIKSDKGKIIVNELNKINLNYILNKKLKKINKEKKNKRN